MKAYIRHLLAFAATFFGSHVAMTPPAAGQSEEAQAWESAKAIGTVQALEDFLARYPIGPYSRDAFREIVRISNDLAPEGSTTGAVQVDPELTDTLAAPLSALY